MKKYKYLIVGAGLFGSIFAYEMAKLGNKCFVIDKRNHIGGNVFTEEIDGINIHKYGAHIFHTDKKEIWEYINQFAKFNNYINTPIANYNGQIYNLPFNMNTFYQMWKKFKPEDIKEIINFQSSKITKINNFEDQAIKLVGKDVYTKLIKGYTEKQWGKKAKDLPSNLIKRLPVRFTYNNNYFDDYYQGIPIGGYTKLFNKLLLDVDVELKINFFDNRSELENVAEKIIFTGCIDEYYNFCYGKLDYRSLKFEIEKKDTDNYQGVAVMNFTDKKTKYTRIIEHKHFEFGTQKHTIISREYPVNYDNNNEPYYPINDEFNKILYKKYLQKVDINKIIFAGRLGEYKYYDMDDVIVSALNLVKSENVI